VNAMSALRVLLDRPLRFLITVLGAALCTLLMLFLLSVYRGVRDGSLEYVRSSDADLWVLQKHTTNILRGSSLLSSGHGYVLRETPGVHAASPVLFVLATVASPAGGSGTVYITGFNPSSGRGGPPRLVRGRTVKAHEEIVLDRAFAAKHGIAVGDRISIRDDALRVVGLSTGTNMFVIQYAFVTLRKAQAIAGLPTMVSCYQVAVDQDSEPETVAAAIQTEFPGIAVYGRDAFLQNNLREMESGILPLLYVVALIGAVVLTSILSLILSVNVLEQRRTFAVLKALGAPNGYIPGFVIRQALILATAGTLAAFSLFHPLRLIVRWVVPEVAVVSSLGHMAVVAAGVALVSLAGSILPNQRLRHVYPLEAFS
jgi:putative ABC transport system permease protein